MMEILFEDKELIVVLKPSNMPCQRDFSRSPDLEGGVAKHLGTKPFLIHRLDRHVEGPLVLAKTKQSAKALNAQLSGPGFEKIYYAAVAVQEKDGLRLNVKRELCHYMKKDKSVSHVIGQKAYDSMEAEKKKAYKKAVMDITCIKTMEYEDERVGLIEVNLKTGRFHQIRSQLSFIGLPIIGDPKYGIRKLGDTTFNGIGLQCIELGFKHPVTKKKQIFKSEHKRDGFEIFS